MIISGANGSGKSRFAEDQIAKTSDTRFYIATMKPQTEENYQRIEKHKKQRQGLRFQTLELPYQVGDAPVEPESVVLLEDVSNLFANAWFEKQGSVDSVFEDICKLAGRCKWLAAVTIAGLEATGYDAETTAYICGLNQLNTWLLEKADVSIVMKEQQPVWEKGDPDALF